MPSRKQRRRRAKERRHEYEFVYVDAEGHEVQGEEAEHDRSETDRRKPARTGRNGDRPRAATPRRGGGAVRKVDPPTWQKVGRRAAIFAPFMFITVTLLNRGGGVQPALFTTILMLAMFVPFSYLMDRALYRRYVRQTGGSTPQPSKRR
jgi:hypothetical protein